MRKQKIIDIGNIFRTIAICSGMTRSYEGERGSVSAEHGIDEKPFSTRLQEIR